MSDRRNRKRNYSSVAAAVMLLAGLGIPTAFSGGERDGISSVTSAVFRDGDDWAADSGAHPQVIRITSLAGNGCTAWLSSSNRLTTNAHCLVNVGDLVGWRYDESMRNSNVVQFNALVHLGPSIGGFIHPGGETCLNDNDDCCWGADLAVLVFDPERAIPRTVLRPLAIKPATAEEPECDGDDRCLMLVGSGRTDEDQCFKDDVTNPVLDTGATQLFLESGLGDGRCDVNDDMLYGEYDWDDSSICKGDSGAPVFWRDTDEVMAVGRGQGGDGSDDVVGPVLWTGGPNTARDFYFLVAGDQDADGIQAAVDNCDRDANPDQADFNGDTVGDACEDSDGDGLLDAIEIAIGTNPADADTDGDGLSDGDEVHRYGTDPKKSDTDGDGLFDGFEISLGTDPKKADTDGDGLTDGSEVFTFHTNPLLVDTDGDGLSDGQEVLIYGTDPRDADSDHDGLSDGDEVFVYGTDPKDADGDDDGLSDGDEILTYGTDPKDPDSDDDLLNDGFEVGLGLDPLDTDSDDDGLIDGQDPDLVADAVAALPLADFKAPGHRSAIGALLGQVEHFLLRDEVGKARAHFERLHRQIDGCGSAPDYNDWVVDCASQLEIRALAEILAANL